MREEVSKLKELIENSQKILLLTHSHPDPDAISTLVFTLNILKKNFPQKEIVGNVEDAILDQYKKLIDVSTIGTRETKELLSKFEADLIIILDIGDTIRLSQSDISSELLKLSKAKPIVMIDHHTVIETREVSLKLNDQDSSCAEMVYKVFVKEMSLTPHESYANELLLGIVGDTGSFGYLKRESDIKSTFEITAELLEAGGSIDEVRGTLNRVTPNQLRVHREYLNNLETNGEYTYTYISDEFYKNTKDITDTEYSVANNMFVQTYLKSVGDAYRGFTVKPKGEGNYTVSFRSYMYLIDLTVFASKLNGNGHKASAGGMIQADNIDDAIKIVKDVIEKYKAEAYANK